jgi:hypothetical protein
VQAKTFVKPVKEERDWGTMKEVEAVIGDCCYVSKTGIAQTRRPRTFAGSTCV